MPRPPLPIPPPPLPSAVEAVKLSPPPLPSAVEAVKLSPPLIRAAFILAQDKFKDGNQYNKYRYGYADKITLSNDEIKVSKIGEIIKYKNGISDNSITGEMIAKNAINSVSVKDFAQLSEKLKVGSITQGKLYHIPISNDNIHHFIMIYHALDNDLREEVKSQVRNPKFALDTKVKGIEISLATDKEIVDKLQDIENLKITMNTKIKVETKDDILNLIETVEKLNKKITDGKQIYKAADFIRWNDLNEDSFNSMTDEDYRKIHEIAKAVGEMIPIDNDSSMLATNIISQIKQQRQT